MLASVLGPVCCRGLLGGARAVLIECAHQASRGVIRDPSIPGLYSCTAAGCLGKRAGGCGVAPPIQPYVGVGSRGRGALHGMRGEVRGWRGMRVLQRYESPVIIWLTWALAIKAVYVRSGPSHVCTRMQVQANLRQFWHGASTATHTYRPHRVSTHSTDPCSIESRVILLARVGLCAALAPKL